MEVQGAGVHGEFAVGGAGPGVARTVPVEFDAVLIRVAEIESFADAVVGGSIERNLVLDERFEGSAEIGARGKHNREMIETGGSGCGRLAVAAFPGVEPDVVMISAGGDKGSGRAKALHELKAEHTTVKVESTIQVRDLEMNVAYASAGGDCHVAWMLDDRCWIQGNTTKPHPTSGGINLDSST